MVAQHELIERGIPDLIATDSLPVVAGAEIDFLAGRCERWTEPGGPMVRARAQLCLSREAAAAALVEVGIATSLGRQELVAGAWVVSRIGPRSVAERLIEALGREAAFLIEDDVPLGPRALSEGPLLAAVGDLAGAEAGLTEAIEAGDARAPLWGARARVELARIKMSRQVAGDPDDRLGESIEQLLGSAMLFFRAGGYRFMQSLIAELAATEEVPTLGAPNLGRLLPGRPWRVGFGVTGDAPLRASKGLVAIRHLVQHPGRAIPAIELDRLVNGGAEMPLEAWRRPLDREEGEELDEEIRAVPFDESARSRVGKLLSRAVRRIGEEHELLGSHLRTYLHAGHLCRYDPPAVDAVVWRT